MANMVLRDEIHRAVLVPRPMPDTEVTAIRRMWNGPRFLAGLGRVARANFRHHATPARTRVRLGRSRDRRDNDPSGE
jgi:hypothetical protein